MNNNNFSFKEGDWVVSNDEEHRHVGLIKSLKNGMCLFADSNGMSQLAVEEDYHLWRIEDAQDGDVLHLGCVTAIFKKYIGQEKCICYCSVTEDGNFEIPTEDGEDNIYGCTNTTPATKEQCNLLWQKMREAGYKWNSTTKEVVKSNFKIVEFSKPLLSARDRGTIDEIIFALRTLGEEKMICYTKEIKFLEKIRKL